MAKMGIAMQDTVSRLEQELQIRQRTVLFLVAEYVSRNPAERPKIIAFLEELLPDMDEAAAVIGREILYDLRGNQLK
ncbi:hypothetical protein [Paracoccus caeni]|uniref:hypothetical protein n=1 Tax=Paracoccus caeni TaxID=657651 RepID=UPI001F229243|nr:hypothetical protein [Paracoccus caeni]